jgi:polar amino acid transport system permease protein
MDWDWGFALSILPVLAKALLVSLEITVICSVLAAFLGLGLALLRLNRARPLSWSVALFVDFIRGTPLLVQLYFLYFGLPDVGVTLSAFAIGVVGFSVHYAAYMSEVFRAGIKSVPAEQWEAAVALSFSKYDTWARIILPGVIPKIIPALGIYVILMLKDTPLLSTITVVELLLRAEMVASDTFKYTEPLTEVGLLFLLVTLAASFMLKTWEKRVAYES